MLFPISYFLFPIPYEKTLRFTTIDQVDFSATNSLRSHPGVGSLLLHPSQVTSTFHLSVHRFIQSSPLVAYLLLRPCELNEPIYINVPIQLIT